MQKLLNNNNILINEVFLINQNDSITLTPEGEDLPFGIKIQVTGFESDFRGIRWRIETGDLEVQIVPGGGTANGGIHTVPFNGQFWSFGIEVSIISSNTYRVVFQLVKP
jgi:hypothetical protein